MIMVIIHFQFVMAGPVGLLAANLVIVDCNNEEEIARSLMAYKPSLKSFLRTDYATQNPVRQVHMRIISIYCILANFHLTRNALLYNIENGKGDHRRMKPTVPSLMIYNSGFL